MTEIVGDSAAAEKACDEVSTSPAKESSNAESNASTETSTEQTNDNVIASEDTVKNSSSERHWDFSNRKVIVHNVMKFMKNQETKKMVNTWMKAIREKNPDTPIDFEKFKKPPQDNWIIVTLKEQSMCQILIDYINENKLKNKKGFPLIAKPADGTEGEDKRSADDDASAPTSKRQRIIQESVSAARRPVTEEEIKNKVTPLWQMSQEEQKSKKMSNMIKSCAMKIVANVKKRFRELDRDKNRKNVKLYSWLTGERSIFVEEMKCAPSPLRNKCEFTFGYRYLFDENQSEDTEPAKVPAVGFMVTGWAGGVSRPHVCQNIPTEACQLVDLVDAFLETSPLPPYDSKVHVGFWRLMTLRTSRRTRECMVIVQHTPASGGVGDESNGYAEHFETERARLASILTSAELQIPNDEPMKVTSVFFQEFGGLSHPPPEHPVQHVFGKKTLTERLGQCHFQISPGAFFQVNTEGAEILYQMVVERLKEVTPSAKDMLLFDVCCGTGTIGLTCLKEGAVGKVVGVDISEPAIADAKMNAVANGFTVRADQNGEDDSVSKQWDVAFVAARAEHVLSKEIGKAKEENMHFVAVVDPAREGLHNDVIRTLRSNRRIKRIVYVSCNPTATLVQDASLLCQPASKKYPGNPFRVTSAAPVDMFPLTDHCEMVMTFDRLSEEELNGTE